MSGPHMDEVRRPDQLWHQADAEHPGDPAARRIRYIALMEEAGFIIKAPTLDTSKLPSTIEDILDPDERAALAADLIEIAAKVRPCWRREI